MYVASNQYLEENKLEHFGIKGMKWGVRRTPEQLGHKRKEKTPEQLAKIAKRKAAVKKAVKFTAKTALKVGAAAVAAYIGSNVFMSSAASSRAASAGAAALSSTLSNREYAELTVSQLGNRVVSGYNELDTKTNGELTRILLNRY